ncbi:autotransporter family protein [Marinobacterium zhoushanense]|nr:autotransporter outer membrane beta-barrel domain-containing protein [Marinobacterium zhoushanense]
MKGFLKRPLSLAIMTNLSVTAAQAAITTNFDVTAADATFQTIEINQAINGWRNAGTASDPTAYTYTYIAINFTTDADGSYTFGQNAYAIDTTMAVYYNGSFDLDSLVDADAYDDDGSDSSKTCGGFNCPEVTANLTAGQVNTLVISTYNPATGGSLTLPISAYATGAGNVIFTVYVPTSTSVTSSTETLRNTPAYSAAVILDANADLLSLFDGLSTDAEISDAASQTLPLLTGAGYMAARTTLYGINGAVSARQDANLGLSSGDAMLSDQHFWIKPFGTWTEQDDRNGVSGYDANTGGLVLGLDSSINDLTRLGVAFAYASTNVDSNSSVAPQSLDIDSYQLIGYGSRALNENTDLTFQADFGQNQNQGKRVIAFTSSVADSDYDSYTAHLGAGVSHTYAINDANRAIATAKADYTWIKDESYTESGAGLLNLDVESNTTEALVAGFEGQLIHTLNPTTELNAKLGVGYDLINEQASITSAFAGAPSAQFTTEGLDPNPWIGNVGFGLLHTADNGAEISANYDAEYRSDYLSQTASIKVRLAF